MTTLRDHFALLDDIREETTLTIVSSDRPRIDRARKALALPALTTGDRVGAGLEPTLALQLARYRDHDSLPAIYQQDGRDGDELFFRVHAAGLKPGDRVDVEDDIYADGAVHGEGGSEFQYELAIVESVTIESAYTVVVHTNMTSFSCPPDHRLPVSLCDICEGNGYFFNPGPNDDAIVVTRCDTCDRFEGDIAAAEHAAKLRSWSVIAAAWSGRGEGATLAPLEEGAVCIADDMVSAFGWIADTINADESFVANGYVDAPTIPRFTLERVT